jgi:Flp pilus assembly protein TadG
MNSLAHRIRSFMEFDKQRLLGLAGDQRGVSAVEFALVLPLMVTLYFGVVETSQGIAAQRKVTLTARTVADLVSQASSVTDGYKNNTMDAATAVMAPFPDSNLKVTVTSIQIDANGKATVAWSDTKNGKTYAQGSTVSLPPALVINNSSLIWSEVEYAYTPTVGYIMSGTLTLKDSLYMRPRLSTCVTRPPVQSTCPT